MLFSLYLIDIYRLKKAFGTNFDISSLFHFQSGVQIGEGKLRLKDVCILVNSGLVFWMTYIWGSYIHEYEGIFIYRITSFYLFPSSEIKKHGVPSIPFWYSGYRKVWLRSRWECRCLFIRFSDFLPQNGQIIMSRYNRHAYETQYVLIHSCF